MGRTNVIGFSIRLCAFFAEQDRMFSECLHAEGEISYSEVGLLCALFEAERPLPLEPLAQLLMLQARTVRSMLLDLEDRDLVSKQSDPADSRFMLSFLTERGRAVAQKSVSDLYLLMKESFWYALPESDFEETLKANMRICVNGQRGFPVEPFGEKTRVSLPIAVDHFIFWRVLMSQWKSAVRSLADISLNDYCTLRYIFESEMASPSEIADGLLLPRSALSLCKSHLLEKGLVVEHPEKSDRRMINLQCTTQGKQLSSTVFQELDIITRRAHQSMNDEDMDLVNAWYARMFSNLWKMHRSNS